MKTEDALDTDVPLLFISFPSTKDPQWDKHPQRQVLRPCDKRSNATKGLFYKRSNVTKALFYKTSNATKCLFYKRSNGT